MGSDTGLRPFIKLLEDLGELRHVHVEVDWKYEVGAIMHEVNHQKGPAISFRKCERLSYSTPCGCARIKKKNCTCPRFTS